MELELQHETALETFGIDIKDYPKEIKQSINSLKALIKKHNIKPGEVNREVNNQAIISINAMSARIAHDMQDYYELNFDEENQNQNNMLTGEELKRAENVGLTETATLEEVVAKEKEVEANTLKERAISLGIAETSTLEEITAAETAAAEADLLAQEAILRAENFKKRALAVNLPETALEAEIEAAENIAKNPPPPPVKKTFAEDVEDWF